MIASDLAQRWRWRLGRAGLLPAKVAPKVDLTAWAPPDTSAAREAEAFLREVSSGPSVEHSLRCYYFTAIQCELSGVSPVSGPIDREALFVAIALHDVGLFESSRPPGEHCFTVGCAREARRIARKAGWDEARQDRAALAIMSNLNPSVPAEEFGVEAHYFSKGGLVDILAQEWKVHPDNLGEILAKHPRDGFKQDTAQVVARESKLNPGCRFSCLGPIFPTLVRLRSFSQEAL
ncbi:MAG: hypothetical protein QM765_14450 [Myxococcales bacterium]